MKCFTVTLRPDAVTHYAELQCNLSCQVMPEDLNNYTQEGAMMPVYVKKVDYTRLR